MGIEKQKSVTLSSTEAKYVCLADATCKAVWLQNLHREIVVDITLMKIYGDNQSALMIARNPQYHKCTKHFDIKHHYICEKINDQTIIVDYCPTENMTPDIFTKPLAKAKFQKHKYELGVS